jgi:hypothetical protein
LKRSRKAPVKYVQRSEDAGCPPTSKSIRQIAFSFVESNCIRHRFKTDSKLGGYDWVQLFRKWHPEIAVRKAQVLSTAPGLGMCRHEEDNLYTMLLQICQQNGFQANLRNIFYMDECGLQMHWEPRQVVATKGSRHVHRKTSGQEGETVTLIGCCN